MPSSQPLKIDELVEMANKPKPIEECTHETPKKSRELKKCSRISEKNMDANADNVQSNIMCEPISQDTANWMNTDTSDIQASNSVYFVSPDTNSGKISG